MKQQQILAAGINQLQSKIIISYAQQYERQLSMMFSLGVQGELYMNVVNLIVVWFLLLRLKELIEESGEEKEMVRNYKLLLGTYKGCSYLVRDYFWCQLNREKVRREESFVNGFEMSEVVRREINSDRYLKQVASCRLMVRLLGERMRSICGLIREVRLSKGERVQEEGVRCKSLYILLEGEVERQLKDRSLECGQRSGVLNEFEFFGQSENVCSIVCLKDCRLGCLDISVLEHYLLEQASEYEKMQMWRVRMQLDSGIRSEFKKCYGCLQKSHLLMQCPYVFYQPNVDKLVNKLSYSEVNVRGEKYRTTLRKYNSLTNQNLISITAINYAQQNGLCQESDLSKIEFLNRLLGHTSFAEEGLFNQGEQDQTEDSKQRSHTLNYQGSLNSPKTNKTARERERIVPLDLESNNQYKTHTNPMKISFNDTDSYYTMNNNNDNNKNNESILVSSSPAKPQQQQLKAFQQPRDNIFIRSANVNTSINIDRGEQKKLSSQLYMPSTSILQGSSQALQIMPSINSPSPIHPLIKRYSKQGQSFLLPNSDSFPILMSDMQLSHSIDIDQLCHFHHYYPHYNVDAVLKRFDRNVFNL